MATPTPPKHVPEGVCPACEGRFMPELEPCIRCRGSGSVPLASIPAGERVEGYYWVKRGDVPEVAFWTLRGTWQFVWSDRDWSDGDIEMLSDRILPPS